METPAPSQTNIPSAYEHPQVIDDYLTNDCHLGRVLGPFTQPPCPRHINRFGVIPKKTQPGRWRLIVDWSFLDGASVNDGIPCDLCSLPYPSIDLAVQQILQLGQDAQLSNLDVKDDYRIVPVHPHDWPNRGDTVARTLPGGYALVLWPAIGSQTFYHTDRCCTVADKGQGGGFLYPLPERLLFCGAATGSGASLDHCNTDLIGLGDRHGPLRRWRDQPSLWFSWG